MRPDPPRPEMNVAPLVDVVLVLLIIFMVITPQMEAGASVEIPTADNPDARKPKKEPITVSVTKDGEVFIEKATTATTDLIGDLTRLQAEDPARTVRIKGDHRARYDAVRAVFKSAQEVGFPGVSIQVGDRAKKPNAPEE
jgi:biopolymer transport protein TolR